MYAETEAKQAYMTNAAARPEGPLNVEVMGTLDQAQSIATEVQQLLYHLRERLVGSPSNGSGGGNAVKTDAGHFKGAHADRSAALLASLNEINTISIDLVNRL